MSINDKIERLKNNLILLKTQRLKEIIIEAILQEEQLVLELNKTQLDLGKDSLGNDIAPEYADSYAQKKGFKTPDLEVSGAFKAAFELEVFKESADIFSTDFKSPFLEEKYGREKIYGLNNSSKVVLIRAILPIVQLKARQFILTN